MTDNRHVLWVWFMEWKMRQQIKRHTVDAAVALGATGRTAARAALSLRQFGEVMSGDQVHIIDKRQGIDSWQTVKRVEPPTA